MRAYMALMRMRFRTLLQYRVAAIAGLATQVAFGLVMVSVLLAFYANSDAAQPMSIAQTITYTWLGQAMLGLQPWTLDREIADSIRSGQVAYDLSRPLDMYTHWYMRLVALRSAPTLLKSIPIFVLALFFLPNDLAMHWPTFGGFAAWVLATLGALLLSCAITNFIQVCHFWTVTGYGVQRIAVSLVTLFSGMLIPLPLFPQFMQPFLRLQPFAGLSDMPSQLFAGSLPPSAIGGVLLLQLAWALVFVLLGRLMLARGLRRVTVAGG